MLKVLVRLASEKFTKLAILTFAALLPWLAVPASAMGTEWQNSVKNYDYDHESNSCYEGDWLNKAGDLTIKKTASASSIEPGDELNYTIKFKNESNRRALNVKITDSLSSNAEFVWADNNNYQEDGSAIIWDLGRLNAGESGTIKVKVRVGENAQTGDEIINTAIIKSCQSQSAKSTVKTPVKTKKIYEQKLSIDKQSSPAGEVSSDSDILYTVTVTNSGSGHLRSLAIDDQWSFGSDEVAEFVDGSASQDADINEDNRSISWQIDELKAGESKTFSYRLHTKRDHSQDGTFTINNKSCVTSNGTKTCDQVSNTVSYKKVIQPEVQGETITRRLPSTGPESGLYSFYTLALIAAGYVYFNRGRKK